MDTVVPSFKRRAHLIKFQHRTERLADMIVFMSKSGMKEFFLLSNKEVISIE
jgi:hypothetical protein